LYCILGRPERLLRRHIVRHEERRSCSAMGSFRTRHLLIATAVKFGACMSEGACAAPMDRGKPPALPSPALVGVGPAVGLSVAAVAHGELSPCASASASSLSPLSPCAEGRYDACSDWRSEPTGEVFLGEVGEVFSRLNDVLGEPAVPLATEVLIVG